jgi:cytochrome d ubiquinol oxidase subunit I
MDATFLSRLQMAFTLGFHILFPALNIGLVVFLALLEGMWLKTGNEAYLRLYRFWVRLFALAFGMGVVSGVVLAFEFGTNFDRFAESVGDVLGPLLTYEVLMAFFLEAGFLPLMLFGWGRVSPRVHFVSTLMVAVGTVLSAFWILAANSWMNTPAGYVLQGNKFIVDDWAAVVFNPSFPYRLSHVLVASFLTTAFVVAGVSAWHLLRGQQVQLARRGLSIAVGAAAILAPAQVYIGDLSGHQVQRDQPMKIAAMEAAWHTTRGAPFVLFALPDQSAGVNRYAVEIPRMASILLKHDPDGEVLGLDQAKPGDRPFVPVVFFSFRVMVLMGVLLMVVAVTGVVLRVKGRLFDSPWFLRACVVSMPLGFVAMIAGWVTTETGRQPWAVYHLLRTADAATPLPVASVALSLALFVAVYTLLLVAFLYFAYHMVCTGPEKTLPEGVLVREPEPECVAWSTCAEDQ